MTHMSLITISLSLSLARSLSQNIPSGVRVVNELASDIARLTNDPVLSLVYQVTVTRHTSPVTRHTSLV